MKNICKIKNCKKTILARGLCSLHYQRWLKHDDANYVSRASSKDVDEALNLAYICKHNKCIFWPYYRNDQGYGVINIDHIPNIVSRVVCSEVHGLPPTVKYQAAHSCGNGHLGCYNPRHLRWALQGGIGGNEADKIIHGTSPRGENQGQAKLSENKVIKIRKLYKSGRTGASLARKFSVHRNTIYDIVKYRRWSWLE